MLFNTDLARRPAMDAGTVLVCEGYMDVIALAQAGIDYAVAPLGTAVTTTQLNLLWQMADAPVMCLDGDAAGIRAMQRASELALPMLVPGKSLHFARLPKGQDPDDVVRERGADGMRALIEQAPGLAEMLWLEVAGQGAGSPEEKAGQEHKLLQLAESIQNQTVKAHYRAYFKEKIWARPEQSARQGQQKWQKPNGKPATPRIEVRMPSLPSAMDQSIHARKAMLECAKLVLCYPQILQDAYALEEFTRIESSDAALNLLCQQIADCVSEEPMLDRAALQARLVEMGLENQVTRLLATDEVSIPKLLQKDMYAQQLPMAQRMWQQSLNAYQLAAIVGELRQAEMEMAQQLSEETMERVTALKSQLVRIEQEREQLYMQDQAGGG
jgi:DNA primase